METMKTILPSTEQDARYLQACEQFGRDIGRFVAGYERDLEKRQELMQEVHLALWQSFARFANQCSLRTWVYRVAHNVGVSHVQRALRRPEHAGISLDELEERVDDTASMCHADRRLDLERVMALVHALAPLEREVMLLYLEDMDATGIADVTGLSARNVATKIHRIKSLLAKSLVKGVKTA